MILTRALAAAAALAVLPPAVEAASLNVATKAPSFAIETGALDITMSNLLFSGFGDGGGFLDFGFQFDDANEPVKTDSDDLVFGDAFGNTVLGQAIDFATDIGAGQDRLEVLFTITDDQAGLFGSQGIATLFGEFGDGDTLGSGSFAADATFTGAEVAPVPLPAGGLLLLGAIGALALRRRSI